MYISSTTSLAAGRNFDLHDSVSTDTAPKVIRDIPVVVVEYEGRKVFLKKERKYEVGRLFFGSVLHPRFLRFWTRTFTAKVLRCASEAICMQYMRIYSRF